MALLDRALYNGYSLNKDVPSMRAIREDLLRQASDLKKALMVQKPVGQRLDNARAAQLRSEKRLDAARQGLALAQQTVQAAEEEPQARVATVALVAAARRRTRRSLGSRCCR